MKLLNERQNATANGHSSGATNGTALSINHIGLTRTTELQPAVPVGTAPYTHHDKPFDYLVVGAGFAGSVIGRATRWPGQQKSADN